MISSAGFLETPLYLNLTACPQCENSFVVEKLKERIEKARAKASLDVLAKIVLVEKKGDLVFEDISYDRRRFFQALKTMTSAQVAAFLDENTAQTNTPYSAKKLPLKRELLNKLIKRMPSGNGVIGILENYAFTIKAGSSCTNCFACVGMCPTGALKIKKDTEGIGLLFNSSLCTGCALCRDFCRMEAVTVAKGFRGTDYFEYEICNPCSSQSHEQASRGAGAVIEEMVCRGRRE
ncbi:MAG: hypothetical protein A2010_12940 [Nitrospirae bacterium GWD2_57_9]|nr:MAG: hypothetical protein A2010_12940 [Nitrospirae bacterium GWD2_57_9]